jgi:hypothetical protein
MDTGATDHITNDLERLMVHDKYHSAKKVHAANGSGMEITHVGHSLLRSATTNTQLRNILLVSKPYKNLLSVHHLSNHNGVFLEFLPNHFAIKEVETRRTLLKGRCEGSLYPPRSSTNKSSSNKQALSIVRPTTSLWLHAKPRFH